MRSVLLFALLLAATLSIASAQHRDIHSDVKETGQASFAAIAEIVASLQQDPKTDWAKVNIDALREHLLDMDLVTMHSSMTSKPIESGMQFTVTGKDEVIGAIQRMTSAHGSMLQNESGWTMTSAPIANGALVEVRASTEKDANQIKALGFYGILTIGAHHQAHHMMMASGLDPH